MTTHFDITPFLDQDEGQHFDRKSLLHGPPDTKRARDRREVPEYPDFSWKEALLNAIAHRDYGIEGNTTEVWLFEDRMEVVSPGQLVPDVRLEDLLAMQRIHRSRNPRLVRALVDLGAVRDQGEGIPRMFAEMEGMFLPVPAIDADRSNRPSDRVDLTGDRGESDSDRVDLPEALQRSVSRLGVRPRREKLRAVIRDTCAFRPFTTAELASILGFRRPYLLVHRHLTPMCEAGLLERTHPETPNHPEQAYRAGEYRDD